MAHSKEVTQADREAAHAAAAAPQAPIVFAAPESPAQQIAREMLALQEKPLDRLPPGGRFLVGGVLKNAHGQAIDAKGRVIDAPPDEES